MILLRAEILVQQKVSILLITNQASNILKDLRATNNYGLLQHIYIVYIGNNNMYWQCSSFADRVRNMNNQKIIQRKQRQTVKLLFKLSIMILYHKLQTDFQVQLSLPWM